LSNTNVAVVHDDSSSLGAIARVADLVMLVTAAGSATAAGAIGWRYGTPGVALSVSAIVLALSGLLFAFCRGTALSCVGLVIANVVLVALHIQLGRGTIEFHFGVFVLLGLLLVYRDWRVLVLGAALFAVHHLLFDRLQALNLGVYCTPQADFLKTAMHALYVVAQTGVEIYLALILRSSAREAAELTALVRAVDAGELICLDLHAVDATAPTSLLMKGMLLRVKLAMSDVQASASFVENAAGEIASGNLDLSQRTERQASNLQETAASMEQITGTIQHSAGSAAQARRLSGAASSAAAGSGRVVDGIVATMGEIAESSRRVAEIVGVIDGIAFQTNILALNAAVEAARAGEQGRGFAVVASEVRGLSQRSTAAAKEIRLLISESTQRIEAGSRLVGTAGIEIRAVVEQARQVDELIGELSTAASQQTVGISQIGEAVTQLDTVTQQNAALVEESAAASENLQQQATRLNDVVRRFVLVAA
jgi:methyl-accepting chemotaxis protein